LEMDFSSHHFFIYIGVVFEKIFRKDLIIVLTYPSEKELVDPQI